MNVNFFRSSTSALALTWFLSLRPVRLKIGDCYFRQGEFDQAIHWYEKVVRKEKLKIDQGSYEEDLSKLKSSLLPVMDGTIPKVSQPLGFEQTNVKKHFNLKTQ